MSFALLHKVVAYLLSGLGLFALSFGSELDESVVALVFFGFAASWFAEGKLLLRSTWTTGWTLAVVLVLLVQVARGVADEPTLAMAIEFAAFLQVSRLFNRRTAVDYQQIAVLAFLHLIAATVLSTSLGYAAIFLGFVVGTPWLLALSHLRREIEGNYTAGRDDAQEAIARVLASRRVVGPRFLLGIAALGLPLFAMTLAIFLVIPRVGRGFLTFRSERGERVAGFGNQIDLGDFGVIRDDPTVVLRVTPDARDHERPPTLPIYLRGTSFDHYDGRRWTRSPSSAQALGRVERRYYPIRRRPDLDRDRALRIVLDHLDEPVVFLPTATVALDIPPRVESGIPIPRDVTHAAGLDIRYENADALGLIYTAYISVEPGERDVLPILPEERQNYLQVPAGHERVAELARRIVGGADEELARAALVEAFLRDGEFEYTLEQPDTKALNPLDVFLFEARRGHCEYFSSAMVIMLRTAGIAARNVAGFAGARYNPYGDYYAVRQGDAHSWVEVFVSGRGWVAFDPTPPARDTVGARTGLWAELYAVVDAIRTRWLTSVIGYDLKIQTGALRDVWRWWVARQEAQREAEASEMAEGERWLSRLPSARLLLALASVAVLAWLAWRLRRGRGEGRRPVPEHAAQAVRLYGELERALRRRGRPRASSTTPFEHARDLAERGFSASEEVDFITLGYMRSRYGGEPLAADELVRMRSALDRVRSASP